MGRTFGLAIIGCGMAATPHGLALNALRDRISVRGVYARSPENRDAFASKFGFPVAESIEALAMDAAIDGALILTPPNARQEIVERFAAAGKHILCEKPLERTAEAAETIVSTCRAAGVVLGVVFQHRFRPASERLAALLAKGALGPIRIVRVDVPWWRDQSYYDAPGRGSYARDGGGVLISQAIHTLDLMLSLAGPCASVQALTATTAFHRMEAEDFVAGALRFENGAVGALMATTASHPGEAESIRLNCDKASAALESGVLTITWRDGRVETFGDAATTGAGADPMAFPFVWHQDLIADFVASTLSGRSPRVTGEAALAAQRLIAAIERSSAQGRRVDV